MTDVPKLIRVTGHHLDLGHLPAAATAEGHSFVARMLTEWRNCVNLFGRPGEGFFVSAISGQVVGMCGLNIDPYGDDQSLGRIRHLYVLPSARRTGIGTSLVVACLELAANTFARVRLRTFDQSAAAFYTAIGFRAVSEPDATHEMWLADR